MKVQLVGEECTVGPFTRLRPGAEMRNDSHVGNFVEVKNARIGEGSKANHLTYLGDAEIGQRTNMWVQVLITCNYDGANKFKTTLSVTTFLLVQIASLIAPVTIADGATIGAGTTLTKDVAEGELSDHSSERAQNHWLATSSETKVSLRIACL